MFMPVGTQGTILSWTDKPQALKPAYPTPFHVVLSFLQAAGKYHLQCYSYNNPDPAYSCSAEQGMVAQAV